MKLETKAAKSLTEKIKSRTAVVGVIGLGYIGLSLLDAFGKAGFKILGYDNNKKKAEQLNHKKSYLNFIDHTHLFKLMDEKRFKCDADPNVLKDADILIISVPTSLDRHRVPDLTNLRDAFKTVGKLIKKDRFIILQSSTYPGTTEEELLPILKQSGLKVGKDFFLAHVPEIADIGNPDYTFAQLPRIVSGVTTECAELAELLHQQIGSPTYRAPSTKIAEAAKLLQNAYRLVNISFINEMKIMFDHMKIDIWDVIKAASVKPFGFTPFYPGPGIGGDCIPIAPFYLVWKAKEHEGPTTILDRAGIINEGMPTYVFNKIVEGLNRIKKSIHGAKILVLGVGYKKDVNDVRESAGLHILSLLKQMDANVSFHDPYVSELINIPEVENVHMKSIKLKNYEDLKNYDAVVIITDHSFYDWSKVVQNSKLIIDTRNVTDGIKGQKNNIIKA